MEDFVQVLWADCTVLELLPTLSVLFSLAFVVNTIRVWRFNRGNLRQSAASHVLGVTVSRPPIPDTVQVRRSSVYRHRFLWTREKNHRKERRTHDPESEYNPTVLGSLSGWGGGRPRLGGADRSPNR